MNDHVWQALVNQLVEAIETAAYRSRKGKDGELILWCGRCCAPVDTHAGRTQTCEVAAAIEAARKMVPKPEGALV